MSPLSSSSRRLFLKTSAATEAGVAAFGVPAGKDVYVEKPWTHNLAEGKAVIEAQNQHQRIVQVGTQQRSMPQFDKGRDIVRSGTLGDIHKVHLTWNRNTDRARKGPQGVDPKKVDRKALFGNAPEQPSHEYHCRNGLWICDF